MSVTSRAGNIIEEHILPRSMSRSVTRNGERGGEGKGKEEEGRLTQVLTPYFGPTFFQRVLDILLLVALVVP